MEEYNLFMGIDVGLNGATIIIDREGEKVDEYKIPKIENTKNLSLEHLNHLDKYRDKKVFCFIEKTYSFPGNSHKSAFMFGKVNVVHELALIYSKIDYEFVSPQKWMKYYEMKRNKEESDSSWKNRLRDRAVKLFPNVQENTLYLYQADAYLIANYCRLNKKTN